MTSIMSGPLTKIPFILATTHAVTASLTNPSPPLLDHERRPDAGGATRFMRITIASMKYIRGVFWTAAAVEIAAILSAQSSLSSSALANRILGLLMKKGTVVDLRLTRLSVAGALLVVAGGLLRLQCFRTLNEFFTFDISIRDDHRLVTTGPYGVVRHPSYTGSLAVFIGLCCWFGGRGSWIRESGVLETVTGKVVIGLFAAIRARSMATLLLRMPEEEKLLRKVFGEEWERWAQRVPYRLVPGFY